MVDLCLQSLALEGLTPFAFRFSFRHSPSF